MWSHVSIQNWQLSASLFYLTHLSNIQLFIKRVQVQISKHDIIYQISPVIVFGFVTVFLCVWKIMTLPRFKKMLTTSFFPIECASTHKMGLFLCTLAHPELENFKGSVHSTFYFNYNSPFVQDRRRITDIERTKRRWMMCLWMRVIEI